MFFLEDLGTLVLWLLATIIVVNLLFVCFVFYRRAARKRYYIAKDVARDAHRQQVAEFASGAVSLEQMVRMVGAASKRAERDAVHELLFAAATPQNLSRISELLFILGYVERWAREAFGRSRAKVLVAKAVKKEAIDIDVERRRTGNPLSRVRMYSVPRALAVDLLSRLAPEYAAIFMGEALKDPASDVRRMAIAGLGRARHPAIIGLLMEELRRAVETGNDVSLRSMKASLCAYKMEDLRHFLPFLAHPNKRMRFFVVDSVREICSAAGKRNMLNKNEFPPEMYAVFLDRLVKDDHFDVRARSAAVIKHFRDQRAVTALRALLNDENEFVRLHAVRVCADRFYGALVADIVRRLHDERWRVREAAARVVTTFGSSGMNELYRSFLTTEDNYASEQIAEVLQRAGMMPLLLKSLTADPEEAGLAENVCRKMVHMRKTSYMVSALVAQEDQAVCLKLMDLLAEAPTEEFATVVDVLAKDPNNPLGYKAASMMRVSAAAAGASGPARGGKSA